MFMRCRDDFPGSRTTFQTAAASCRQLDQQLRHHCIVSLRDCSSGRHLRAGAVAAAVQVPAPRAGKLAGGTAADATGALVAGSAGSLVAASQLSARLTMARSPCSSRCTTR